MGDEPTYKMMIKNIHGFEAKSKEEFLAIQNKLVDKIKLFNNFRKESIHFCAGADLAYWEKDGEQYGVCSIVVIDYKTKEVLEKVHSHGKITTPYAAGFLAFRELPLIIEAARKLTLEPDVFLFDGNGYLHFNHMGIATHASFFLNKPTIGAAKSYLRVGGADFQMPGDDEGSYEDIVINGEVYGRVLRTRNGVKPIFISCGNYIDLETCTEIVTNLVNNGSKLPIPVRLAHLETHFMRNELR